MCHQAICRWHQNIHSSDIHRWLHKPARKSEQTSRLDEHMADGLQPQLMQSAKIREESPPFDYKLPGPNNTQMVPGPGLWTCYRKVAKHKVTRAKNTRWQVHYWQDIRPKWNMQVSINSYYNQWQTWMEGGGGVKKAYIHLKTQHVKITALDCLGKSKPI